MMLKKFYHKFVNTIGCDPIDALFVFVMTFCIGTFCGFLYVSHNEIQEASAQRDIAIESNASCANSLSSTDLAYVDLRHHTDMLCSVFIELATKGEILSLGDGTFVNVKTGDIGNIEKARAVCMEASREYEFVLSQRVSRLSKLE